MKTYLPTMIDSATVDYPTVSADVLRRFAPIGLDQMEEVALLRRIDTKYVLSEAQLYQALGHLPETYRVLEIEGRRQQHYQTLYFDTADFALYHQHHNGWRSRYKVRSRLYAGSGLAFLEVKHKTNQNITIKHRVQTPTLVTGIDEWAEEFLYTCFPYPARTLVARLQNSFRRITLIGVSSIERVTLDFALSFQAEEKRLSLPGIAIAEVKQTRFSPRSEFVGQMRTLGLRPLSFSKYCFGVAQLYAPVKANRFKLQQRYLATLTKNTLTANHTNLDEKCA